MTRYRCNICNVYEYDDTRGDSVIEIKPGTKPEDFPDEWKCPICKSDKTHQIPIQEEVKQEEVQKVITCPHCGAKNKVKVSSVKMVLGGYLGEWEREHDELETHMADIHKISVTGESIVEPMRTTMEVISYDEILIKGAQLAKIPLNHDEPINTKTIIGPKAKFPL